MTFKQRLFGDVVPDYFYEKAKKFIYKLESKLSLELNPTLVEFGINPTSNLENIFYYPLEEEE